MQTTTNQNRRRLVTQTLHATATPERPVAQDPWELSEGSGRPGQLPQAVAQSKRTSFLAALRQKASPASIVRGVLLGPFVVYVLLGTLLLYLVHQAEILAVWLARGKAGVESASAGLGLAGLGTTPWHEQRLLVIVAFPVVVPCLALRALVVLVPLVAYAAIRWLAWGLAEAVRLVGSGLWYIIRGFFHALTRGVMWIVSPVFSAIVTVARAIDRALSWLVRGVGRIIEITVRGVWWVVSTVIELSWRAVAGTFGFLWQRLAALLAVLVRAFARIFRAARALAVWLWPLPMQAQP